MHIITLLLLLPAAITAGGRWDKSGPLNLAHRLVRTVLRDQPPSPVSSSSATSEGSSDSRGSSSSSFKHSPVSNPDLLPTALRKGVAHGSNLKDDDFLVEVKPVVNSIIRQLDERIDKDNFVTKGLYRQSGEEGAVSDMMTSIKDPMKFEGIMNNFDTYAYDDWANALKRYIRELIQTHPILTADDMDVFFRLAMEWSGQGNENNLLKVQQFLVEKASVHYRTFLLTIFKHAKKIVDVRDVPQKLDLNGMATCWGPTLFQPTKATVEGFNQAKTAFLAVYEGFSTIGQGFFLETKPAARASGVDRQDSNDVGLKRGLALKTLPERNTQNANHEP